MELSNEQIFHRIATAAARMFPLPACRTLTISIAGHAVTLRFASDELYEEARRNYAAFVVAEPSNIIVEIAREDVFEEGAIRDAIHGGNQDIACTARWDFCALLDRKEGWVRGFLRMKSVFFSCDALVRMAFSSLLIDRGFLLVHGVALAHNGQAALFVGPSQSGKSTLARAVAHEAVILSDDIIALTFQDDTVCVHSTPFWSLKEPDFSYQRISRQSAKLVLCATLAKSAQTTMERLEWSNGPEILMPNVVYFGMDSESRLGIFSLILRIHPMLSFYRLHFPKDRPVWTIIQKALLESGGSGSCSGIKIRSGKA